MMARRLLDGPSGGIWLVVVAGTFVAALSTLLRVLIG